MRSLALGLRRRCAACGCAMVGPVYIVLYATPGSVVYEGPPDGGLVAVSGIAMLHKECALFSTQLCPFLKYPISRRRVYRPGDYRGTAEIWGFQRYGIYYGGLKNSARPRQSWKWAGVGPVERIPFTTAKSVKSKYLKAAEDSQIDVNTRLYWRNDSESELRELLALAAHDSHRLEAMRATALTMIGSRTYPLALVG
jgi:hypothetical protein